MIGWPEIVMGLLGLVRQQASYIYDLGGSDTIEHQRALRHIEEIERVVKEKVAAGD